MAHDKKNIEIFCKPDVFYKIQTQLSDYFLSSTVMTKPERRCLKEMVLGILKSKTVFVNQIAASLRESLKLKDVCKRLSSQYLKEEFLVENKINITDATSEIINNSKSIYKVAKIDAFILESVWDEFMETFEFTEDDYSLLVSHSQDGTILKDYHSLISCARYDDVNLECVAFEPDESLYLKAKKNLPEVSFYNYDLRGLFNITTRDGLPTKFGTIFLSHLFIFIFC
ncbi:MAG: hypothetical protein HRT67_11055 [Flavobacteriaceae bacterium]|nr:hypothetical protein [Flavobacteriaceae bacterium]